MLADNGMKVLAVDLDKQGDTTNALLSEDESEYSDNGKMFWIFSVGMQLLKML